MIEYASTSVENVSVQIKSPSSVIDLTTDTVFMAFVRGLDVPQDADWNSAEWDPTTVQTTARCLIGPGNVTLAPGIYKVWVKINDNPESPVRSAGAIKVV